MEKTFVYISDINLAVHFSGWEVKLIPIIDGKIMFEQSITGDDWYIINGEIHGYDRGPFIIGVDLEKFHYKFCIEMMIKDDPFVNIIDYP